MTTLTLIPSLPAAFQALNHLSQHESQFPLRETFTPHPWAPVLSYTSEPFLVFTSSKHHELGILGGLAALRAPDRQEPPIHSSHTPKAELQGSVEESPLESSCDKTSHFLAPALQRFLVPELSASFRNKGKRQKVLITGKRCRNEQPLCHLRS